MTSEQDARTTNPLSPYPLIPLSPYPLVPLSPPSPPLPPMPNPPFPFLKLSQSKKQNPDIGAIVIPRSE